MSDYDGMEVAWGPEPVDAAIAMHPDGFTGDLAFVDPKTGRIETIAVTVGASFSTGHEHVWHAEAVGDEIHVSPSVHFLGHFHTGIPARFRLA